MNNFSISINQKLDRSKKYWCCKCDRDLDIDEVNFEEILIQKIYQLNIYPEPFGPVKDVKIYYKCKNCNNVVLEYNK